VQAQGNNLQIIRGGACIMNWWKGDKKTRFSLFAIKLPRRNYSVTVSGDRGFAPDFVQKKFPFRKFRQVAGSGEAAGANNSKTCVCGQFLDSVILGLIVVV
jgi:hypothetical protein